MDNIRYGLEDRVVVVTGGSRGIGLEIAKELINQGAKVAICGRKQDTLEAALYHINGGERVIAISAHIAKEEDVERLFEKVHEKFLGLDVLINNVGMNLLTPSVAEADLSLWQKIMDTNLNGTFLCCKKASKIMKIYKKGKIVNVSSLAGRRASHGMGIYGIAKAGVEMLTKVLASELALSGIQVNAVAPSMVKTEFSKVFWSNEAIINPIIKGIPLGRIAEPIDIVHPVLFLASDASNFITGQTLLVDGGSSAI